MIAKQTKRFLLLGGLAAVALASFGAATASAAVSLGVSSAHSPVESGDEYFTYTIDLANTGDSPTTAATNVNIALPVGMILDEKVSGAGWSCLLTASTCTYSNSPAVAGLGGVFPSLTLGVLVQPGVVGQTTLTTFTAFGGGATDPGISQSSIDLGPGRGFGLVTGSLTAGACSAPPALNPTTAACSAGGLGDVYKQAGGHPFAANTTFGFVTKRTPPSKGDLGVKPLDEVGDGAINLPAGFVANPTVVSGGCTIQQVENSLCPERFAVGRTWAQVNPGFAGVDAEAPVYKIQGEKGYPATFALRPIRASSVTVVLRPRVRPSDGTITAFIPKPPQGPALEDVKYFTFCSYGVNTLTTEVFSFGLSCKQPDDVGAFSVPFLTNPTRCNGQKDITSINVASWQNPGRFDWEGFPDLSDPNWKSYETTSPELDGCNLLPFQPRFEGRPTTNLADSPSGLNFDLRIPQNGLIGRDAEGNPDPDAIATAHLKKTTVSFPEGMVVNPSSATGLEACTEAQMGLVTTSHPGPFPIQFNGAPVQCPNGSKLGTVEITSPLIDETVKGGLFLAKPYDNPFGSLLALYIAVRNDEIGLSAKLAGKVEADPVTGKLTTTFDQNPQLPFDHLELKLPEGARASLRTPPTCGTKATSAQFTSWSTQTPSTSPSDSFAITQAPGGGPCAGDGSPLPNAPRLDAGTVNPKAGAYSPFVLRLARPDGSQELQGIDAVLPPGLTGRLAGVPYCSEAQIALARSRSHPREGAVELASPSCPAASELGKVEVSAGAGPTPYRTGGTAYLAGPYKGAPVSMVVITPAVAGPFDLGTVVVRNALYVNPVTAQVSVKSDPIPHILEGIPLDVRSIEVSITRNQFTLNPTNCEPMALGATAFGLTSPVGLTNHFQVGECAALGFKPRFRLRLHGGTSRAKYQRLVATVTYPKGDYANISRAAVTLPHSAFLAQEHIRTVCTRVQFAADACPKGAIYGRAKATTPLLDYPLSGPVYLRSSNNPLPDLVAALRGPDSQPIEVELSGRTDSKNKGIRNTFDVVPDAPVTKFRLELFGGKKSLIVNSRNLCKGKQRATVRLKAHNGRRYNFRPPVGNDCKKKRKKGAKAKKSRTARTSAGRGGRR